MPRHTFRFPEVVRNTVREYIDSRIKGVDPRRYNQEPAYCVALIHSLVGIVFEGTEGFVQFETTSIDDRGRNSAEHFSGADFAITATVSNESDTVRKAILVQAKLGTVEGLGPSKLLDLKKQVQKMKKLTRSPKVMEIVEVGRIRQPRIISGTHVLVDHDYVSETFGDYMVRRVLTTLDGDTRPGFVDGVQDSSLSQLRVRAYSPLESNK